MRGRGSFTGLLAVIAIVVALGLGGWALLRNGTGCAFAGSTPCLRVLFIGNSYTSANDLPGTFAALVRSGGGAVEVRMIAPGGAFLADQASSAEVAQALAAGPWAAVVLQEQSQAPASPQVLADQSVPGSRSLALAAMSAGAAPYLLQTWAHRDGWPEAGMDYARMQAALDAGYDAMAASSGATVVRAGDAWQRVLAAAPAIALWADDGSHPSIAGTYLAACVLYQALTGRSPAGLGETAGLPAADAALLQVVAAGP
ncbi:MAG: hypothetical protein WCK58_16005 [Chloroflexota bacterium]